ncbi:putative capsid protein [Pseudomonas phage MR6]|uniref:Putative capsid protein n=1 Tax=Pseudomonas phage MR5 TaxID=2711172 RepID=A0A6M3TCR2_9CAUD|nr:putative capsid protein [Pseudomonas phage MR5]QJD54869.1 putative capsid protein [Pseudomonas phage MR6]QJD54929.1 putative capsid protein [Pseudomonas phage MR7]QJD54987.1 major capsid protein [Pseudomonas phage MR8]QJD55044.1 major capsid protein [Pseudomonas phage MR12]QJD55347.1 putative capsid protein [Pseudomonas phage MR18]QJF74611.1 putative capsid protein [Pseudomonas phage MR16]
MTALTNLTRPQWGGPNSDVDIHIEEHLGIVDKTFAYSSQLANVMNIRNLRGTNTARIDRFGDVKVGGRKSGEALVQSKVVNDKFNLTVDTVLYLRHEFDKFDDWTTDLQYRKEIAELDGTAMAKQFDQACLIQAAKCADFKTPTGLEGSFNDGVLVPCTITNLPSTGEADADILVRAHRKSLEALIQRDLGDRVYSEAVTYTDPAIFTVLLEHKKLMNVEYQAMGGVNDYARSRIAMLNGVKLVETPRVVTAAITNNPLGSAFNMTAAQARRRMITIIPTLTLVTAQVHALAGDYWEDKREFSWVLDTFQSYNIGQRRPDSAAVVDVTTTNA